jgi:hypothetical protein
MTAPTINAFVNERPWVEGTFSPALSWETIMSSQISDNTGLNRQAARGLPNQSLGFNIPSKHNPEGFSWNAEDNETHVWYPQGIAGTEHAYPDSYIGARRRALVVSWYGKDSYSHKGVRLSFVDYSSLKYRHILLVQNSEYCDANNANNQPYVLNLNENRYQPALFYLPPAESTRYTTNPLRTFAPIPIHAGGIAWYKNFIYVVDSWMGIRVFDTTRIFKAEPDHQKNQCGRISAKDYAFDYRYIMPQIGFYKTTGTAPNSFISVGNGEGKPCLWMGQYLQKGTPQLFRLMLKDDGLINTAIPIMPKTPKDEGGSVVYGMQGAYRGDYKTWLSVTGRNCYENSSARLITQDGASNWDAPSGCRWRWPLGAESLYLEKSRTPQKLWCLTEYPEGHNHDCGPATRVVFGVDFSTYQPEDCIP